MWLVDWRASYNVRVIRVTCPQRTDTVVILDIGLRTGDMNMPMTLTYGVVQLFIWGRSVPLEVTFA